MATIYQLRVELKECNDQLKRFKLEYEYQRRIAKYWRKRYNILNHGLPCGEPEPEEPLYTDVKEHFEKTGSLFDEEREIR